MRQGGKRWLDIAVFLGHGIGLLRHHGIAIPTYAFVESEP
jgi:hypothetical protein